MGSYEPSKWARERFGDAAGSMGPALASGLQEAHRLALSAHLASGLRSNDAYGSTLRVTQHEELITAAAGLPGVVVRRPAGVTTRFEYVVIEDLAVVLMPWRFSNTRAVRRVDARLPVPVSGLRKSFLALGVGAPAPTQLTLEQGSFDPEDLEAQLAEEQELYEQLARLGRVVTVAFGSNPTDGLFEVGWGDAELINENTGEMAWRYWEPLPMAAPGAGGLGVPAPLRPVGPNGNSPAARFDAAPLNEDLGLVARPRTVAAPLSEAPAEVDEAGGEDGQL